MPQNVLLVGASVRAAAQSAARAGFAPLCADLFADRDLRAVAVARRVRRYANDLLSASARLPDAPFLYTGALENYPAVVDALARRRTLWGNCGAVLRTVRDPLRVARSLREAGLTVPDVLTSPDGVPRDGTWLRKPQRGGGGGRITVWDEAAAAQHSGDAAARKDSARAGRREPFYFQRRIDGQPCAAIYVAAGGAAVLLGVTRQLIGAPWTSAAAFHYAGSLGPLTLSAPLRSRFERLGQRLAADFNLVGIFGVDAVLEHDTVWPIEINPRFTASVEVLERGLGIAAIAWHAAACRDGRLPRDATPDATLSAGKAIIFAPRDLLVPERLVLWAESKNRGAEWPATADIPEPRSRVAAGRPVLTVLCADSDPRRVEASLRARVAEVEALLDPPAAGP